MAQVRVAITNPTYVIAGGRTRRPSARGLQGETLPAGGACGPGILALPTGRAPMGSRDNIAKEATLPQEGVPFAP